MKELSTGKELSDSILTSSLAGGIVRCRLKRRPEALVGRGCDWSFEKPVDQDADSMTSREEGNTATALYASGCPVLRVVDRARAPLRKQHAREPGDFSSMPWSGDSRGRSAKAINHNADVYVPGEVHTVP